MKRYISIFLGCIFSVLANAQDYLPDSEILEYAAEYEQISNTSGTLKVKKTVKVNKEEGKEAAVFSVTTSSFSKLGSFKALLIPSAGKAIKFKNSDLVTLAVGEGLAEDTYVSVMQPGVKAPYTITYEWTVSYKNGITSYPSFLPVSMFDQTLKEASYKLTVPSGFGVKYASNLPVEIKIEGGKVHYNWRSGPMEAIKHESLMPSLHDRIPYVYAHPENIVYGSYAGHQSSWEDVGAWMQTLLDQTGDISQTTKDKVAELTSGLDSEIEKIRAVYDYLGANTRYVSIQLGVGGYKPMSCNEVEKTGFGDCKALSNYMKALLKSIGIDSYYTILATDTASFPEELSTASLMDHAMLCVPLKSSNDTLWVECTNPSLPLGYRHGSIAGHEVVYVKDGVGVLTRVGAYPESFSRRSENFMLSVKPDGACSISGERTVYLDFAEAYVGFKNLTVERQNAQITSGTSFMPDNIKINRISNNFSEYGETNPDEYCPYVDIAYSMESKNYAKISANRMFIPINPVKMSFATQRSKRENDIRISSSYSFINYIEIETPEGWEIESIASDVDLSNEWLTFKSTAEQESENRVVVHQVITLKEGLYSKELFPGYKEIVSKIGQANSANIILKKQ